MSCRDALAAGTRAALGPPPSLAHTGHEGPHGVHAARDFDVEDAAPLSSRLGTNPFSVCMQPPSGYEAEIRRVRRVLKRNYTPTPLTYRYET